MMLRRKAPTPVKVVEGPDADILESLRTKYPERSAEIAELSEQIRHTPQTCEANGMYATNLIELLRSRNVELPAALSPSRHRYFPMRNHMQLMVLAGVTAYPHLPAGEAIRRLGRLVIPAFARSPAGSIMMELARSWEAGLGVLARGYHIAQRPGEARVVDARRGYACLALRNIWSFGETYHRGVVEGLMEWCHVEGTTTAHKLSRYNTDILIEWRED